MRVDVDITGPYILYVKSQNADNHLIVYSTYVHS